MDNRECDDAGGGDKIDEREQYWKPCKINAKQRVTSYDGPHRHRHRIRPLKSRNQGIPALIIALVVIILLALGLYLYGNLIECRMSKSLGIPCRMEASE
jgi:hypothetical protein